MEAPITFSNHNGEALVGIIHTPDAPAPGPRVGVTILNAGLKGRVAPNRMNVKIARMLCERGFHILRFDAHGLGDSAGEFGEGDDLVMDLWGAIQRGAFVADARAANDYFVREARLDELVLLGQCGGAVTALLAAGIDGRVGGVILADLPVRVVSAKLSVTELLLDIHSPDEMLLSYLGKLVSFRSWVKLLTRRSDLTAFFRVLSAKLRGGKRRSRPQEMGEQLVTDRFNRPLLDSCHSLLARGGKLSLLFAEHDFSLQEFRQDLLPVLSKSPEFAGGVDMHIVKGANHIYTEQAWQEDLLGHVAEYAERYRKGRRPEGSLHVMPVRAGGMARPFPERLNGEQCKDPP